MQRAAITPSHINLFIQCITPNPYHRIHHHSVLHEIFGLSFFGKIVARALLLPIWLAQILSPRSGLAFPRRFARLKERRSVPVLWPHLPIVLFSSVSN